MPDTGPSLATLQAWLKLAIQHPVDTDTASRTDAARALIPRGAIAAGEVVRPSATMTPFARVDVYNNGYLSRLVEVLESDFGVLRDALGDGWRALAHDFVYACPSTHPNLNGFGARLPAFVATREALEGRAFLAELADLEWAIATAFHAPEFTPLDATRLGALGPDDWATAVLVPNPSLQLRHYDYPTNGYLQAAFDGERPDTHPARHPTSVAIYRAEDRVWRVGMPAPIAAILGALIDRRPLAAALEAGGDEADDVQRWFQEWAADGLFVAVDRASEPA